MPDKLHIPTNTAFALPDHAVIEFSGPDAGTFAQAQLMNDVAALEAGHWQWNGWLTPKGRLLALFALLKHADGRLWLLVPDRDPDALADGLRRYLFRSKVAIEVRGDLQVGAAFATPDSASSARMAESGDEVELDLGTDSGPRRLLISARSDLAIDPAAVARWQHFDLEHGLPRLPDSQVEHWTPQQLSLQRLRAFSIKKGCYPGQEIVARTHFLGKAKRGLALLQADTGMPVDAEVIGDGKTLGRVLCTARGGGGSHIALAVLPLQREPVQLSVDRQPARECPLKGGLSR